jgi:hypothetical protein
MSDEYITPTALGAEHNGSRSKTITLSSLAKQAIGNGNQVMPAWKNESGAE